jgi:hypothetical protein
MAREIATRIWPAVVRVATPETGAVLALLAGWCLLTWGIAALTVWQAWPISLGLLLLGCFGYRLLVKLLGDGLYVLYTQSREER